MTQYEASEALYRRYSVASDKCKGRVQKLCLAHSIPRSVYMEACQLSFPPVYMGFFMA